MKTLRPLLIIFALICFQQGLQAQQAIPKTLLWRISGKGLQKPSYLYGTMHLYDRRLFFFGDSVYNSIEHTEGFAMELNPDDIMDSVFSKMGAADTTSLLRKVLDEKKFDSVSEKLEKRFGMPANKITRKKIIDERESWYYKIQKKDDMKSIVDLYLYDIAHKQGKWVGGIEDVDDQLGIKDELGKDINITDYLNETDKDRKKFLEKMIDIYVNADLDQLDEMTSVKGTRYKDILLLTRNIKMARRMDSLSNIRSSFFAVGAAHLPGDSGVIQLLRKRGFTVEPVFSSKKIAPEKYTYTAVDIPWTKFTDPDSTYTVEIPGKISNLDVLNGELKFRVCSDLVTNNFYMTAYSYAADQTADETIERLHKYYTSNGFKKDSEKKITNSGIPGIEIISAKEDVYYRLQIFVAGDKFYLCVAGCLKKENLVSKDVERFLNSFTINEKAEPKITGWVDYSNEEKAFSVSFPKKPSIDKLGKTESGEHMDTHTYSSIDLRNGAYYMLVVNETEKGFVMAADSLMFNSKMQAYKENNSTIEDIKYFKYEGYPAMSFTAYSKAEGYEFVSKLQLISRGNRFYTVANVAQKGKEDFPEITKFFRSFKLLPYKSADWGKRSPANALFSTWTPSAIELNTADSLETENDGVGAVTHPAKSELVYLSYDPNNATSYNVNVYPLGKYYWAENDKSFFAEQLKRYYTDTASNFIKLFPGKFDSLLYKKQISAGTVKGYEILVADADKISSKKIRVYLRGDSVYHIFLLANASLINNENNNKFFTDFRFANENIPSNVFVNKTALILTDLQNKDSATRSNAVDALENSNFTVKDLPSLYGAYFKQYLVDSATIFKTINQHIGTAISKIKDNSVIDFVKDNYAKVPASMPELKMNMLEILAEQQFANSYALIKQLLLADRPVKGAAYSLVYNLCDSLLLSKDFFPELSALYADSLLGSGLIRIAVELIDSNMYSKEILLKNKEGILHIAEMQLEEVKKDKDAYPDYNGFVIDALGKLNDKKGNELLHEFVKGTDISRKEDAALALIKNDLPVAVAEIQKLAADNGIRSEFYASLKKIGKEKLFPKEFLVQKKFAEAYLYNYITDDEEDNTVVLTAVGEKIVTEDGEQNRYYLFKLTTSYDGEKESYLAVCGPFDVDKEKMEIKNEYDGTKVFYDQKYSASSNDELFEKFINEKKAEVKVIK